MSGDSKKGGGENDDLLSELLGLDVSQDDKSTESDSTEGEERPEEVDFTEVLSSPASLDDQTESQTGDKASLDAFLGVDTVSGQEKSSGASESTPAPEQSTSAPTDSDEKSDDSSDKAIASAEVSDDTLFDEGGISGLEDQLFGEAADNKNPFAKETQSKTLVLGEDSESEGGPGEAPDKKEPMLEEAIQFVGDASDSSDATSGADSPSASAEAPQDPSEEMDPIERALRDADSLQAQPAAKSKPSESSSDESETASDDSVRLTDLFGVEDEAPPAEAAPGVSEKDFADIFHSGPIQVPGAQFERRQKWKLGRKQIAAAAGVLIMLGSGAWGVLQLRSDEGLLGYQLQGLSITAAYRPPTAEQQQIFENLFSEVRQDLAADDPQKMEAHLASLRSVLDQDERNFEAIGLLMESLGRLMAWKGLGNEYPQQFDRWRRHWEEVETKAPSSPDRELFVRAQAWRNLALSDYQAGVRELEALAQIKPSISDSSKSLLAELLWHAGDVSQAKQWLERVDLDSQRRAGFLNAKIRSDANRLDSLASAGYLPAQVHSQILASQSGTSAREALALMDRLTDDVGNYPWLQVNVMMRRGDLYHDLGDSEKARKEWKAITERFSNKADVWLKLARSYKDDMHWEESLEAYRSAVRAGGLTQDLALEFVGLLRLRMRVNEAFELLEESESNFPEAEEFPYERGLVQLSIFQEENARQSFLKSLEINSAYEPAILSLAHIAMNQEEYDEAAELFSRIPEQSKNYSNALVGRGELSLSERRFDEAQRYFARAIRTDDSNEAAYIKLIKLLLRSEKDREAEAIIGQASSVLAQSPWTAYMKAQLFRFRGQTQEAIEVLEPVIHTHSHLRELRFLAVHLFIDRERFDQAEESLDQLAESESENPDYLYALAQFQFQDSRNQRSGAQLDRAWRLSGQLIQRQPDHEDFLLLRAQVARARGDRTNAHEVLNRLLSLYPSQAQGHLLRGDLHVELGNYSAALESFEKARQHTRFRGDIYRSLGRLYQAQGNLDRAVANMERVVEWFPRDASAHLDLGRMYNDQGRYQRAIQSLRHSLEIRPHSADAHFYLGFIYKETGEDASALRHFERFLELRPSGVEAATIRDEVFFLRQSGVSN